MIVPALIVNKRYQMTQLFAKKKVEIKDEEAEDFRLKLKNVGEEVHREVIGLETSIEALLVALIAGESRRGHVLFEAAPGRGKTLLVNTIADVLNLKRSRVQGTPDQEPMDFLYTHQIVGKSISEILFTEGPVFTNILLADELNRVPPKSQSALLEPMEEASVTFEGQKRPLPHFHLFATQNPIETAGTYGIAEALMDRFMFKILVEFPTQENLSRIIARDQRPKELAKILNLEELIRWSKLIYDNYVLPLTPQSAIVEYISSILFAAYQHPAKLGGIRGDAPSVRPGEDLKIVSGISAFIEGRDRPTQHDVKKWVKPVLRGRYPISKHAAQDLGIKGDHINTITDNVIQDILDKTPFIKTT